MCLYTFYFLVIITFFSVWVYIYIYIYICIHIYMYIWNWTLFIMEAIEDFKSTYILQRGMGNGGISASLDKIIFLIKCICLQQLVTFIMSSSKGEAFITFCRHWWAFPNLKTISTGNMCFGFEQLLHCLDILLG